MNENAQWTIQECKQEVYSCTRGQPQEAQRKCGKSNCLLATTILYTSYIWTYQKDVEKDILKWLHSL